MRPFGLYGLRSRLRTWLKGRRVSATTGMRDEAPADEVFRRMAQWIADADNCALDAAAAHHAKRAILDASIGMLAGLATAEGRAILQLLGRCGHAGESTVPGTGIATSAPQAAYAGTALCQVHDANDGHPNGGLGAAYHPGRVLVPTAIALAAARRRSGRHLVAALAAGYDIAANTMNGPMGAPSDAYGAAATACHMLGLSLEQTAFALRVSGFCAPRSGAQDFETNNLTCAQQARSGTETALLVEFGYPPSNALTLGRSRLSFRPPEALGASMAALYFKPYPSCRATHPFIDAALRVRNRVVHRLETISEVRLHVPRGGRAVAHKVPTGEYFKSYEYSVSYCTVAALVDGEFGVRQVGSDRTGDPLIQHLQDRVVFVHADDPANRAAPRWKPDCCVELLFADGEVLATSTDAPLGSPQHPLTDEEIALKLVRWLGLSHSHADRLLDTVIGIDGFETIEPYLQCLEVLGRAVVDRARM